ncbi:MULTISPECIES: hypothetical protein [Streptomyces]|uniref:hypothetical protein n=1 Tax=Streptomyces TaxID=1883 RepID=UPI00093E5F48|nr:MULTISPECIES: hypothetical protein [Streptomyces]MBX9427397.1 hypothetical protein [Streptomyces lateritius]OKJ62501.1 hypothetical protein AMK29_20395 [Streptomyces sp. CB02261]
MGEIAGWYARPPRRAPAREPAVLVPADADRDAGRPGWRPEWTEAHNHRVPGDGQVFRPLA